MARFITGVRLHDYGRGPLSELFAKAARDGFQSVQLALPKASDKVYSFADVTDAVVEETRQAAAGTGVSVAVMGCYVQLGLDREEEREKNVATYLSQLPVAAAMGALCIGMETTEMYHYPAGTTHERGQYFFCKSLEKILPEAERLGVQVAMEPAWHHSVGDVISAKRVIDTMQSPNLKVIFDPANLVSWDKKDDQQRIWDAAGELIGDRIIVVHMKGMQFSEDGTKFAYTHFDDSCVDFEGAFRMLRQLPQTLPVLREDADIAIVKEELAYMKSFF